MADMMQFPNSVEEFMESYKMVDRDEVYSNGTEYVPIFRMRQWLDHLFGQIDFAIKSTNLEDAYSVGMRNGMKYCKALIDGKEPKYDDVN